MSGVWLYLAIGLGLLLAMLLMREWRDRRNRASDLLRALQAPKSRRQWLVDKVLVPSVAGLVVVFAWPLVLVWAAWEWWSDKRSERTQKMRKEAAVFRIRTEDLLRAFSIDEVEQSERIRDPMGAVPDVPFGHLHAVWLKFLQQRPEGAELWSFACDWTTEWGTAYARRGYVWVKNQEHMPWILTSHVRKEQLHA